jgi:hypothetical protein
VAGVDDEAGDRKIKPGLHTFGPEAWLWFAP